MTWLSILCGTDTGGGEAKLIAIRRVNTIRGIRPNIICGVVGDKPRDTTGKAAHAAAVSSKVAAHGRVL